MNRPVTVAPPAVTVAEITEPTAVNAGIELLDQDAVQLESTPLRARRVVVRLGNAAVIFHSSNLRVRTRTSTTQGLLAYVTFGAQAKGTVNGLPVRPDLMLVAEPETEAQFVVDPGWQDIAVLLPPDELRAQLALRQREHEFVMPRGVGMLEVHPDTSRGLFDWGKRLVDIAAREPGLFNERKSVRDSARFELLETLLAALDAAGDHEPTRNEQTRQAQSLIVKAAEDFAVSHAGDHLLVGDLCKAAGVSERSLQYAFKDVLGLSPVAYLNRLRLHRVRKALIAGTHGSTTVSAEALNWGFWHFGDFSRAYRECFGELPSDTLRRKHGEPEAAAP
jgi:AraC-like DNA-binding protein